MFTNCNLKETGTQFDTFSTSPDNSTTNSNTEKSFLTSILDQLNGIRESVNALLENLPNPVKTFDSIKSVKEKARDNLRGIILHCKDWVYHCNQQIEKCFNTNVGQYREYPKKIVLTCLRSLLNLANCLVEAAEKV